ncbi:hypothetical protein ACJJTC_002481 [Scirpophaga incertulas]
MVLSEPTRSELLLKVTNPTGHEMRLRLLQPSDVPVEDEQPKSIEKSLEKSLTLEKEYSTKSVERTAELRANCRVVTKAGVAGEVTVVMAVMAVTMCWRWRSGTTPPSTMMTPRRRREGIILWRKSNKMALRLQVETSADVAVGTPATAAVALEYSYRNTVPPSAPAQRTDHTLYATFLLQLGQVTAP